MVSCGLEAMSGDRVRLSARDALGVRVAYALPRPVRLAEEPSEQHNWAVRFVEPWLKPSALAGLERKIQDVAIAAVRASLAEAGYEDGSYPLPGVKLRFIDGRHLLVGLATPRAAMDRAHTYLTAASGALTYLHRLEEIDDIQGLPVALWSHLVGPRGARPRARKGAL